MFAKSDPTTNPVKKTATKGNDRDEMGGGKVELQIELSKIMQAISIQNTEQKRVKKIVKVPPILKNR